MSDLDAYKNRLVSFTEIEPKQDLETTTSDIHLKLATKSSLRQDIPEISINLREFYAFKECSLNQLIAERNTALGKMQLPSNRFAYEVRLLDEMMQCKKQLQTSEQDNKQSLIDKLTLWIEQKQDQLPFVWSNLITQSDEVYRHISTNGGFISADSNDQFQSSKQALQYLITLGQFADLSAAFQISQLEDLEGHLQVLAESSLLAKKWRTQVLLKNRLDDVSKLLKKYLLQNTCSTLQHEQDIAIMRNIFTKFFVNDIQGFSAELNKYHYQLQPIVAQLMQSSYLPEALIEYIKIKDEQGFADYKQSMQTHIELWQTIFARCE